MTIGTAGSRSAICGVATFDAFAGQLIAVLSRTIRGLSALHAAAAVARAELAERGSGTLRIFVALITDEPGFIATVRVRRAICVFLALFQAAIR